MNKICGYNCEHNKGGVCQITYCDKIGGITTTTQWLSGGRQQGKTYQLIKDQQEEIERLKQGYCELKVKCNNGECDCTNEEYDGMVEGNMKLSLEVDRLNNIINKANKCILDFLMTEEYIKVDGIAIANNYNKLMNILGTPINYDELKEGK